LFIRFLFNFWCKSTKKAAIFGHPHPFWLDIYGYLGKSERIIIQNDAMQQLRLKLPKMAAKFKIFKHC
jgi:hypothetical protein